MGIGGRKVAFFVDSKDGLDKQAFTLWGIICKSPLSPHFQQLPLSASAAEGNFTVIFIARKYLLLSKQEG